MLQAARRILGMQPGIEYPPQNWVNGVHMLTKYTPDVVTLERYFYQHMFVYNEWQSVNRGAEILKGCDRLAGAFTVAPFTVWNKNLGGESYPIVLETQGHGEGFGELATMGLPAQIKGELYKVPSASATTFNRLDTYMQNGVSFKRKRMQIAVPYTDPATGLRDVKTLEAWMYIGNPDYWDPLIDNYHFSPAKVWHRELTSEAYAKKYYYYNEFLENSSK